MNADKSVQVLTWKNTKKPLCSVSSGIFIHAVCVCVCVCVCCYKRCTESMSIMDVRVCGLNVNIVSGGILL